MCPVNKDEKNLGESKFEKSGGVPEELEVGGKEKEKADFSESFLDKEIESLQTEIGSMDLGDGSKQTNSSQKQNIAYLEEEKKLKKLLDLAKSKGADYAIKIAKKMNDPYLLDKLHDELIKSGFNRESPT
jgi:hypothetical protein